MRNEKTPRHVTLAGAKNRICLFGVNWYPSKLASGFCFGGEAECEASWQSREDWLRSRVEFEFRCGDVRIQWRFDPQKSLAHRFRQLHKLKKNNVLQSISASLIVSFWPKLQQSGPKIIRMQWSVQNFIAQSGFNQTRLQRVPRLISLLAGLVPQRGLKYPETTFFKKVYSVNRMCRATNWNEWESKASSCLKRD